MNVWIGNYLFHSFRMLPDRFLITSQVHIEIHWILNVGIDVPPPSKSNRLMLHDDAEGGVAAKWHRWLSRSALAQCLLSGRTTTMPPAETGQNEPTGAVMYEGGWGNRCFALTLFTRHLGSKSRPSVPKGIVAGWTVDFTLCLFCLDGEGFWRRLEDGQMLPWYFVDTVHCFTFIRCSVSTSLFDLKKVNIYPVARASMFFLVCGTDT